MGFPRFWHRGPPDGPDDGNKLARGRDAALADEVVAFLAGRLVAHYAAAGRVAPGWAAINRVAHADRTELLGVVASCAPADSQRAATTERLLATRVLDRAPTAVALHRLQADALIPMELRLIELSDKRPLGADEVLNAALAVLDSFFPG